MTGPEGQKPERIPGRGGTTMLVKASKGTAQTIDWDIETTRTNVETYGVTTLNAVATPNFGGTSKSVQLSKSDFAPGKSSNQAIKQWDYLAVLGGRQSVFDWLRLQGNAPAILNPTNDGLFVYIARKHRWLDKDLTMVMLAPRDDIVIRQGSWDYRTPTDVKNAPEHTRDGLAEILPHKLGDLVRRVGMWPD
jgi:hypothetical protein